MEQKTLAAINVFCEYITDELKSDCHTIINNRLSKDVTNAILSSTTVNEVIEHLFSCESVGVGSNGEFRVLSWDLNALLKRRCVSPKVKMYMEFYNFIPGIKKNLLPVWVKGAYRFTWHLCENHHLTPVHILRKHKDTEQPNAIYYI